MEPNNNTTTENPQPVTKKDLKKQALAFLTKNKNLLLIAAIIIVVVLDLGIAGSRQLTKSGSNITAASNKEVAASVTNSSMDGAVDGVKVDDPDNPGEYIIYHYDGTLESSANPQNDTYVAPTEDGYVDPGLTPQEATDLAMKNPGVEYQFTSSGGTVTKIISDGVKTYSPDGYHNAFPPSPPPPPPVEEKVDTSKTDKPVSQPDTYSNSETAPKNPPNFSFFDKQQAPAGSYKIDEEGTARLNQARQDAVKHPGVKQCAEGQCFTADKDGNVYFSHVYSANNQHGQLFCDEQGADCKISDEDGNMYNSFEDYQADYDRRYPPQDSGAPNSTAPGDQSLHKSGIFQIPINTASAPEPSETRASIAISTAGLGTNSNIGQNPTPSRPQFMQIQILNPQGQVIKDSILTLLAQQASGSGRFKQLLSFGKDLPAGNYQTRIKLDNTLWKTINTSLAPGTQTNIPPIELVLGDIDQDNAISLADYNSLIGCLGQKDCTKKIQADLNLDGKVDELDLNLLYNSFKTRQGD